MSPNLNLEIIDGIAELTLSAPPLNLISKQMTIDIERILDRCEADPSIRVLIVTGSGVAFCGGSDIKEFPHLMTPGAVIEKKLDYENIVYSKLAHFRGPSIAAVNGLALGGGLELAVCCDFVIAEKDVPLGLPECRLGIFPGSGGTVRVTRRVGEARAKQMIFLGDRVPTDDALNWGLVDKIVEKGAALSESRKLAQRLNACSQSSLELSKKAVGDAIECTEGEALQRVLGLMDRAFCAPDAKEGVSAFLEKRKPNFNKGGKP